MNTTRVPALTILFAAVIGLACYVEAVSERGEAEAQNTTPQDNTMRRERPRRQTRIERMLERIKNIDPNEAKRLDQLQNQDPNEFRTQLNQFMRAHREEMFGEMERPGMGPAEPPQDENSVDDERDRRGRDKEGRWGRRGMMGERMKDMQQKHEEYLDWLKENYPQEAAQLEEVRQNDPEMYMRRLMESGRKYGRVARAAKENPALAEVLKEDIELKDQRDALLEKIAEAKPEEKDALTAQLRDIVAKRFDLILKRKEIQHQKLLDKLDELKKHVEHSQAEADKWKASKDEKVDARVKELLEQKEQFHWD